MPGQSEAELRDGALVEAKFTLPQQRTSLVVSFAKKEEDFVSDIIVELYGCVGYVRHGDSGHIVCQSGKALSCPTSEDGPLRIKAQGPETWRNQEDATTLRDAVRSGLVEAASGGAKRVGVLMKFSLHHCLDQQPKLNLAHMAARIFSKQCPAAIEEVNVCLTPDYSRHACAAFVSECHKLVLGGHLLPHTVALPSDEPAIFSMLTKNKNLQNEVDVLRKQMEGMTEQKLTNKNLQDEVDALRKQIEGMAETNKKLQDEVDALRKQMGALEEQRQTEVAELRMRLDGAPAQNTKVLSHHQRQRKKKQTEQIPRTPEFSD